MHPCLRMCCLARSANHRKRRHHSEFWPKFPTSVVSGAVSGSTLTLDTHGGPSSPSSPTSIPILITQLGNVPIPTGVLAFETFEGVTSAAAQVGSDKGGFSGTIIISAGPGGTGQNILTTTFAGGTLTLPSQGSGSLNDAQPPFSVSFTSANPDYRSRTRGNHGGYFRPRISQHQPVTDRYLYQFHGAELRCFLHHGFSTPHSRARLDRDGALGRAALGRAGHARLQAASAQVQVI